MSARTGCDPGSPRDSTDLLGHPESLRAELAASGYLLLRGIVPSDALGHLAAEVERTLAAHVGPLPRAGATANGLEEQRSLHRRLFRLQALHELPHCPELAGLMAALLGEAVLTFPRPVCRVVFPEGDGRALPPTPAHQDLLGMQGTDRACTVWLPLTACPLRAGPLAIAAGSHCGGLRSYRAVPGARVATCEDAGLERSWVSTDFAPGDLLVFSSLTVHQALPNRSGSPRCSVDFRFQPAAAPICERSLAEDGDLPWEEVYREWGESTVPYYWQRLALETVAFDPARLITTGGPGG